MNSDSPFYPETYLKEFRRGVRRGSAERVELLVDAADLGGEPEVSNLDHVATRGEEDVLCLEVAVDEEVVVHVFDAGGDLREDEPGPALLVGTLLGESGEELPAGRVLHYELEPGHRLGNLVQPEKRSKTLIGRHFFL